MAFDCEDEVRAREFATLVHEQPVADLASRDDVDRLLERGHAGVLGGRDPVHLLRGLDPAPLLVDITPRPDVDVVVAQVVRKHGGEVGVDVDPIEPVLTAHGGHQGSPTLVLVAAGARRRDLQLEGASNLAHRCLLAGAPLLERARPEHGVAATPVDHNHRVGDEETGAIEDVGVVIGFTEEQHGAVVTHMAEPTSPVSRSRS